MIEIKANGDAAIRIGKQGENGVRVVVFDLRKWVEALGKGEVSLFLQRDGDTQPYPCTVSFDGKYARWVITSTDVDKPGIGGVAELVYTIGEQVAKSQRYSTVVAPGLGGPLPEAPAPGENWINDVLDVSAEVKAAAELVQDAPENARRAEAAQDAAETAQEAAETAQGKAEEAQAAAETAQGKAEDAQAAAETAQGKAEDAQAAAETAQGKAEDAQAAAEAAQDAAETAQAAAETAQGKAEEAQEAAETAQAAAETAQGKAEDAMNETHEALAAAEEANSNAQTALQEAEAARSTAEDALENAQGAQTDAETALAAAEVAQGKADDALDAAGQAVTTAGESAAAAQGSATAAQQAQAAAEVAQGKAEEAQEAAETAQAAAETAQGKAEDAQAASEESASQAASSAATAQQYSGNPARAINGTWWVWDAAAGEYVDTGASSVLSINKSYPSVEAMEADVDNAAVNDIAIIAASTEEEDAAKLYIRTASGWMYLSDLSGMQGPTGAAATINGVNALTIQGGDDIDVSQSGGTATMGLKTTDVAAGSYGPVEDASPGAGETFTVPQVTVDAKGRVTGAVDRSITLPDLPDGTTSQKGIVQLSDSTSSTSTTLAATANAVKAAKDAADAAQTTANGKWTAQDGTTSQKGIVQLSSSTSSTSTTLAATASAVKSAYDLASTANTAASTAQTTANGKWTAQDGTTSQKGIVQLSDSTSSTSTTLAATANAVKTAYDLANSRQPALSSIAITTAPLKTIYRVGEEFDPTGMVVNATYANNVTVAVSGFRATSGPLKTTDTSVTIQYSDGGVTKTATQAITVTPEKIYGVFWDGSSTTKLARTDDSRFFVDPVPYVSGATSYGSPFDNLQPWAGMVRVTDSEAGELVAIPKFWFKWTKSGNTLKLQISDHAITGFYVSPAHADRGDGKGERDVVYAGRYHCSATDYKSTTGVKPKASITRSTARTAIAALGDTIWQFDMAMRVTIQMLYLVEFADWNSQDKIGYGCGNNSAAQNVGASDSMPYHTGTMQSSRTTYGVGVQYRYIEGLWDNAYDWMDGCYYTSSGLNIINNPANFSDSAGGTLVGKPSSGYPSALTVAAASGFEWVFYPTAASGSNSTYVPDYWDFYGSNPCLYCGGGYSQSQLRGLFYVVCNSASVANASIGCRLQKLP